MRAFLAAAALAALLAVSGCGVVDDAKQKGTNSVREQVASRCKDQAKNISNADTRKRALEACEAARSGDARSLRRLMRKQCFDRLRAASDPAERRKVADQCRKIEHSGE